MENLNSNDQQRVLNFTCCSLRYPIFPLRHFSSRQFRTFNEGISIPEQMNCTIKAQVMGQHVVIQRQNAKLRCFPFTEFSLVARIISLLTRKDVSVGLV